MEAIKSWLQFQFHPSENVEQIKEQIIWLKSNVIIQMYKGGIMFMNDIVNKDCETVTPAIQGVWRCITNSSQLWHKNGRGNCSK